MATVVSLTKEKILSLIPSMDELVEWVEENIEIVDPQQFEDLRQLLEQTRQELAQSGQDLDTKLQDAKQIIDDAIIRLAAAETRLVETEQEISDASDWIQESGEELKTRLADAEINLGDARVRLGAAEVTLANGLVEIATASEWISDTGAQLNTRLGEAEQTLDDATVRLISAENRLTSAEGQIVTASNWIAGTGAQLGSRLSSAEGKLTTAQNNIASAQSTLNDAFPTGPFNVSQAIDTAISTGSGNTTTYTAVSASDRPGPAPTSTSGRKTGDIHRNRNGSNGDIYAEWRLQGSAWQPNRMASEVITNLDVGKLSVGTANISDLVAERIAAKTGAFIKLDVKNLVATDAVMDTNVVNKLYADVVRSRKMGTDMLMVGQGENVFPDPYFEEISAWANSPGINAVPDAAAPGSNRFVFQSTGYTNSFSYYKDLSYRGLMLEAGAEYRIKMAGRRGGVSPYGDELRFYIRGGLANGGSNTWSFPITNMNATHDWGYFEFDVTIPNELFGGCTIGFGRTGTFTSSSYSLADVTMIKKASASLIVDGAITAKKITITGDADNPDEAGLVANIASIMELDVNNLVVTDTATIDESVVNKLWVDVVRSRKITSDMLIVGSGTNYIVDPHFLDAPVRADRAARASMSGSWGYNAANGTHWFGGPQANSSPTTFMFSQGGENTSWVHSAIEVVSGERLRMRAQVNVTGRARFAYNVVYQDQSTGFVTIGSSYVSYSAGLRWIESTFVVPENVVRMVPSIQWDSDVTVAYVHGGASLTRLTDSSLIVDGAITAKKITITGDANNPDETGLVANIASIMKLDVNNLVVTDTATMEDAVIKKLYAEVVRSRKITTDMLMIGSGINLLVDPGFTDSELTSYRSSISVGNWTQIGVSPFGGTNRVRLNNVNSGVNTLELRQDPSGALTPIDPGETYRIRFRAVRHAEGSATVRVAMRYRRSDGSLGYVGAGDYQPMETDLTKIATAWHEFTWTAPNDAVEAAVTLQVNGATNFVDVVSPSFTVSGASLIVDGTIASRHINVTGTLTSRIADIIDLNVERLVVTESSTFKDAVIEKLWTDVIRARKITTDMLVVGSGENLVGSPYFYNDGEGWTAAGSARRYRITGGYAATASVELYASSSQVGTYYGADRAENRSVVDPGEHYRFSAYAMCPTGPIAAGNAAIFVRWYGGAGALLLTSSFTNKEAIPQGIHGRVEHLFQAPPNAAYAAVGLYSQASHNAPMIWSHPYLVKAASASLIVDGSIAARHIIAEAISGEHIEGNTIDANHIRAGAITAGKINATALDGKVITGSQIRTNQNPWVGGGLQILGNRLQMWDSKSHVRVNFNPENDDFVVRGILQATNTVGQGLEVRPPSGGIGGWLDFVDPTMANAAYIATGGTAAVATERGSLTMVSAATQLNQRRGRLRLEPGGDVWLGSAVTGSADTEKMYLNMRSGYHTQFFNDEAGGGIQMGSAGTFGVDIRAGGSRSMWVQASRIIAPVIYSNTATSGATVAVGDNGELKRVTSLRDSKLDIKPLESERAQAAFYDLQPVSWIDRSAFERGLDLPRVLGFVAEDLDELEKKYELEGLTIRDDSGRLTSAAYDRIVTLAVLAVRELSNRVKELEEK